MGIEIFLTIQQGEPCYLSILSNPCTLYMKYYAGRSSVPWPITSPGKILTVLGGECQSARVPSVFLFNGQYTPCPNSTGTVVDFSAIKLLELNPVDACLVVSSEFLKSVPSFWFRFQHFINFVLQFRFQERFPDSTLILIPVNILWSWFRFQHYFPCSDSSKKNEVIPKSESVFSRLKESTKVPHFSFSDIKGRRSCKKFLRSL